MSENCKDCDYTAKIELQRLDIERDIENSIKLLFIMDRSKDDPIQVAKMFQRERHFQILRDRSEEIWKENMEVQGFK